MTNPQFIRQAAEGRTGRARLELKVGHAWRAAVTQSHLTRQGHPLNQTRTPRASPSEVRAGGLGAVVPRVYSLGCPPGGGHLAVVLWLPLLGRPADGASGPKMPAASGQGRDALPLQRQRQRRPRAGTSPNNRAPRTTHCALQSIRHFPSPAHTGCAAPGGGDQRIQVQAGGTRAGISRSGSKRSPPPATNSLTPASPGHPAPHAPVVAPDLAHPRSARRGRS